MTVSVTKIDEKLLLYFIHLTHNRLLGKILLRLANFS